ncbi:unnamed protein product [Lactuca virosa]|uniref:Uncharacterized protein n=1 Tax=Lactuca virosa TaxID=75947 RepID=A0AAU9LU39_9ASTR|nr:unnamed protein product [Lactuca virosa]
MTTGDTGGASGKPTSRMRPMMSLEPITTPIFTPVTDEAPQQDGSTITAAPMSKLWRPIAEGSTSSATVLTQNASTQNHQLTTISSSTTPPTVDNVSGIPVLLQAPPQNQTTR